MHSGKSSERHVDIVVLKVFQRFLLERHARIFRAARHVEQLQLPVGCCRILIETGRDLLDIELLSVSSGAAKNAGAEFGDPGEGIQASEPHVQSGSAAGGESRDSAAPTG